MGNHIAEICHRVSGIPCLIGVVSYVGVPGSYHPDTPSDLDYTGYTECEWEILDRGGRRAEWLAKKMTPRDREVVERAISEWVARRGCVAGFEL